MNTAREENIQYVNYMYFFKFKVSIAHSVLYIEM